MDQTITKSSIHHSGDFRFNGTNVDLNNYLAQFEAVSARHDWDDTDMGSVLIGSLEGAATKVMAQIPRGCISYVTIADKLRQMFAPEANVIAYRSQFQCRKRGSQESSTDFSLALQELAAKGYPQMDHGSLQQMQVDQFIRGQPTYIRFALASGMHRTLEEVVAASIRLECYAQDQQSAYPPRQGGRRQQAVAAQAGTGYHGGYPEWPGLEREADFSSQGDYSPVVDGHMSHEDIGLEISDLLSQQAGLEFPGIAQVHAADGTRGPPRCQFCGKVGHVLMQCRLLLSKLREQGYKGQKLPTAPNANSRQPSTSG